MLKRLDEENCRIRCLIECSNVKRERTTLVIMSTQYCITIFWKLCVTVIVTVSPSILLY